MNVIRRKNDIGTQMDLYEGGYETVSLFNRKRRSAPVIGNFYTDRILIYAHLRYEKRLQKIFGARAIRVALRIKIQIHWTHKEEVKYIKAICVGASPKSVIRHYLKNKNRSSSGEPPPQ